MSEKDFGFARVYAVELKYRDEPKLDRALLYQKMEQYTGKVGQPDQDEANSAKHAVWEANEPAQDQMLHFFHLNYMVR
ncbi:hypothetical protein [Brevibacillus invocatus]|uniref:hypothetical protein n=1 Tax=Brevibacillus invocatus TaxID=173959 RepID=UPI001FEBF8BD|nr:hypothetical protein [Brevibacillus invocatus]